MKIARILLAMLVVLAVGCGKEGALESVSAPEATAAPTTKPTKGGAATAAPSSSAAPAGAGSRATTAPAGGAATARPAAAGPPLSEAALEKTLLSDAELRGWTRSSDGDGGEGDEDFAPCGKKTEDTRYKPANEAERNYSKGQIGDQLGLHNESYTSANQAHLSIEESKSDIKSCPTWTHTEDDGTKITFTAKQVPFPNLGDETVAFRITFTGTSPQGGPAFKINGDGLVVLVRLGQNIVGVFHMSIALNSEPELDTAETESITRKAVDKFKRAT